MEIIENIKLKEATTFIENGLVYLKLIYTCEDDHGEYELTIPKVALNIEIDHIPDICTEMPDHPYYTSNVHNFIKTRMGETYDIYKGDVDCKTYLDKTTRMKHVMWAKVKTKDKPVELSLKEIEEKLGYSVKIVNKED